MKQYPTLVWTPEMVENYWDYQSRFPESYFTHENGAGVVRCFEPHLRAGETVLDYGCGPGHLVERLLARGFQAAGMDASPETRSSVGARLRGREGFLGVFSRDELAKAGLRFGGVAVLEVIEHLYDEQLDELLQSLRGLLREDGVVLFTTPNEEKLEKSYVLCPVTNQLFHRWQHVRSWSRGSLTDYLSRRGFTVLECAATNFRATFRAMGGPRPWRRRLTALGLKLKYGVRPGSRRPHLMAIARPG